MVLCANGDHRFTKKPAPWAELAGAGAVSVPQDRQQRGRGVSTLNFSEQKERKKDDFNHHVQALPVAAAPDKRLGGKSNRERSLPGPLRLLGSA